MRTGSEPWRRSASNRPVSRRCASCEPLGMVQRMATNKAAVSGISSSTSTRITISSA